MQDLRARTSDPGIHEVFTAETIESTVQHGGLWIPAGMLRAARLRPGIMTGRLSLTLAGGRSVKLLWAKSNLTYASLHNALGNWLHDRLSLD